MHFVLVVGGVTLLHVPVGFMHAVKMCTCVDLHVGVPRSSVRFFFFQYFVHFVLGCSALLRSMAIARCAALRAEAMEKPTFRVCTSTCSQSACMCAHVQCVCNWIHHVAARATELPPSSLP